MSSIKKLTPDLRNKIAAGEVVERPMSVVKELLENSIDAGSSRIRIDVLQGGKKLVRVADNGSGMGREDLLMAFERHATSKISREEDLFRIDTMGFRGEALPAIASVSLVAASSGTKGSSAGTSAVLEGGEFREIKDCPSPDGTVVEVRDLFWNTPARKKFLKSTQTENAHVIETVTRAALSHFGIGFQLTSDRQETMNLPPATGLKERLLQIFGADFLGDLIETKKSAECASLHVFCSLPGKFRKTKSHQHIFINRRPVKDSSLSHAVYSAYEGIIARDEHPIFYLFLDITPAEVDFNVHPAKREVRLSRKEEVYRLVASSLRSILKTEREKQVAPFLRPDSGLERGDLQGNAALLTSGSHGETHFSISENAEFAYRTSLPHIYIGGTYIALSGKGGLTILDHHAAHERVLYEKILNRLDPGICKLLFPQQVQLSPVEYQTLIREKDVLFSLGIEIDDFGENTILVRAVPEELLNSDMKSILSDMSSGISEGRMKRPLREELAARLACHSSVRGRSILSQEQVDRLVEELEKTETPDQCPHGRPTRIFYSLEELDRLFKRK